MTSLLIGLWVWPTVLAPQASPKDSPPPSERAMRKECAGVGEDTIKLVSDFTQKLSRSPARSHGEVITEVRKSAKAEGWAVPDACVVEIVRLAYERTIKERKARQEAEAKAAQGEREAKQEAVQLATWNALTETEKRWVILAESVRALSKKLFPSDPPSSKPVAPFISCGIRVVQVGQMGIIDEPVIVTNITSSSSAIGELRCPPEINKLRRSVDLPEGPESIGVWISGVDTSKLTTGCEWTLTDLPFEIVGTKTYSTANGSNRTVFDVQLLSIDPHKLGNLVVPKGVTLQNYKEAGK